ncbi:unnamed protein product [Clonostachys rosea]|uniref:Uncharacterized protein n=1 Tax=Bionectria ochroleuca TaxID=29856 RepID=A0ABY6UIV2_BIOOC|nr:unnamed protein product [Clonostachys rosea]
MAPPKKVIIIGVGVSGLGMAIQLKRVLGHSNFLIYEKSDNIGGTWWHNRYPACACDIPSHFYCVGERHHKPTPFALNPDWTTTYPARDELHDYFFSVAEKYDILPHCRFDSMCLSMKWDSLQSIWICTFQDTQTGKIFIDKASAVVSAVGTLDRPYITEIEGSQTFSGKIFHSAQWDDSVDVKNKNVVVLGNGASATQFVPVLVDDVAPKGKVTQLVRSAHWWTKRGNPKYSELFKMLMRYIPFAARAYRIYLAWELEKVFYSFYMNASGARMRQKTLDATNEYIQNDAPAEYRDILTPNYEPGCKRRVNTATYFAALHSPNMHLDKTNATKIGPDYIETSDGKTYPADVIIYATGCLTQKWLHPIEVRGEGGRDLHEAWDAAGGAEAYKGTVVSGFPNFFIMYGPNAATGQHSVIFHSECQINYTCRLLHPVLKGRSPALTIMVKPEAQRRDLSWVQGKLKELVFNSGCQSWWMDPKTRKNTFIYPDPMFLYWLRTIFPRWSDFELRRHLSSSEVGLGAIVALFVRLAAIGGLAAASVLYKDRMFEAGLALKKAASLLN